jgi:Flp pilus assembly pilin Flp
MKKNLHGQGLVEYVILITLISIGIILALNFYGLSVRDVYCNIADKISNGNTCTVTQICQDDFSTNLAGWTTLQGAKGSTTDGKFCPPTYTLILNACSTSKKLKDYTVKLNGANLGSGNGYGVVFRAENTQNGMTGYVFQYDPGYSPGSFIIRKWANGVELNPPLAVAPANGYNWYNTPRDIQVNVKGDTFTAYVDGKPVLTAKDSTYTSGGAGLRTWDSTQVCFDQFGMQSAP